MPAELESTQCLKSLPVVWIAPWQVSLTKIYVDGTPGRESKDSPTRQPDLPRSSNLIGQSGNMYLSTQTRRRRLLQAAKQQHIRKNIFLFSTSHFSQIGNVTFHNIRSHPMGSQQVQLDPRLTPLVLSTKLTSINHIGSPAKPPWRTSANHDMMDHSSKNRNSRERVEGNIMGHDADGKTVAVDSTSTSSAAVPVPPEAVPASTPLPYSHDGNSRAHVWIPSVLNSRRDLHRVLSHVDGRFCYLYS